MLVLPSRFRSSHFSFIQLQKTSMLACVGQLRKSRICGLCHSIYSRSSGIAYSMVLGPSVVPKVYVWCSSAYSGIKDAARQSNQDVGEFCRRSFGNVADSVDENRSTVAPRPSARLHEKCLPKFGSLGRNFVPRLAETHQSLRSRGRQMVDIALESSFRCCRIEIHHRSHTFHLEELQ